MVFSFLRKRRRPCCYRATSEQEKEKLLLGKRNDSAVQEYVLKLKLYECPIDTYLVVAAVADEGITKAMEWLSIAEVGRSAKLTKSWAKYIAQEDKPYQDESFRSHPAQKLDIEKCSFLLEALDAVVLNDIPPEPIFNWDKTGITLVPSLLRTLDKKGKEKIDIAGHQDKLQIITVICGSLVGELLPFQLVHGGKTNRCHPTYNFPLDRQIVENHWSNEKKMNIVPFVNHKR